ncbi:MAG: glycosyltransferase, partial [Fidelibacterota bacterium]
MTSIAQIITRLDRGGSAEIVMELSEKLQKRGFSITLVTGRTVNAQRSIDQFVKVSGVSFYYVEKLVRELNPLKDVCAFFSILKIIKKVKPMIVHTHSSKAGIIGRAAAYAAGVPYIIHSPHGHIFYGYYGGALSFFFIFLERIAAKCTRRIVTLTESGML